MCGTPFIHQGEEITVTSDDYELKSADKYLSFCFDSKKLNIAGNCDPAKEFSFACRTYCEDTTTEEGGTTTDGGGGGGSGGDCSEVDGFTAVPGADFCFRYI